MTCDFGELAGYTFRTLHPAPHHWVVATYEATLAQSYDKYWAMVNRLEADDEGEDAQSSTETE